MEKKKNSKKISQHNMVPKPKAKIRSRYFDHYLDMFSFREKPVNDLWLERLASDLVQWSYKDDALKFTQFLRERGINSTDFGRWLKRSEILKEAHKFALQNVGDRREIGGLKREFDAGIVKTTMAQYDENWRLLEQWRAFIHASSQPSAANNEEFCDSFVGQIPDSDKVPLRI